MATRRTLIDVGIAPRLLTREQAAAYCGVSVPTFMATCPVEPIALGDRKRLSRYDIHALDQWINEIGCGRPSCRKDWLNALGEKNDGRTDEGP